ncbi:MAG: YegS/Rv2252/BmrU family lipid kinase [Clostridiales bacterium]|nr:YegS/Rv2252/BmrU family lipid kinase [Candidatus Equinaster intestinalis]
MKEKKIFLIANPKSGRAKVKDELLGIISVFTQSGYTVTVYPTTKRRDATEITAALSDEYEMIVCCGGDGTLNEIISGMMQNENEYKLGYIPLGTLNEWSSSLHISRNARQAAKDIISGRVMSLDIGKFGDKYFAYTASFGAFTSASYSAPQGVKNALGQVAYILEGAREIASIKPIHLKFTLDEKTTVEGDYLYGGVSNSLSCGGVIKLDEALVKLDDGLFEIVLIEKPDNIAAFGNIVDAILTKKYDNCPYLKQFTASRVLIEGQKSLNWTLDGELAKGGQKTEILNLQKAVKFIIPSKE